MKTRDSKSHVTGVPVTSSFSIFNGVGVRLHEMLPSYTSVLLKPLTAVKITGRSAPPILNHISLKFRIFRSPQTIKSVIFIKNHLLAFAQCSLVRSSSCSRTRTSTRNAGHNYKQRSTGSEDVFSLNYTTLFQFFQDLEKGTPEPVPEVNPMLSL